MITKVHENKTKQPDSMKRGFISASLLALLLVTLVVSLSLGRAMEVAVERTGHCMAALSGGLAFEKTLLELDLGMPVTPYASGSFSVTAAELQEANGRRFVRVILFDQTEVKETVDIWLKTGVLY